MAYKLLRNFASRDCCANTMLRGVIDRLYISAQGRGGRRTSGTRRFVLVVAIRAVEDIFPSHRALVSLSVMASGPGGHGVRVSTLHASGKTSRIGPGRSTSIGGGWIIIFISGPWEMQFELSISPLTVVQLLARGIRALISPSSPLVMACWSLPVRALLPLQEL